MFMRGRLSDFPLEMLASSLELCRQPIELVLRRNEEIVHRVLIKAGRITAVQDAFGSDVDAALTGIRRDPGTRFDVYRRSDLTVGPSVASLRALIADPAPIRDSSKESPAPANGRVDAPAASGRHEVESGGVDVAGVQAQLAQIVAELAGLRTALEDPNRESANARTERVLSRIAAVEAYIRRALPRAHADVTGAMHEVLAELRPNRSERLLLRCVLGMQIAFLVVSVALLVLAL